MAMSDFGLCNNGEALYECLAMNVPVLVNDNLSRADSYRALMYDSFVSEINLLIKGETVPELVGMKFPEKVTELWSEFVINPRIKFSIIDKAYDYLDKFLPFESQDDKFVENRISYKAVSRPDELLAEEVIKSVEKYEELKKSWNDKGTKREARSGLMREQMLRV